MNFKLYENVTKQQYGTRRYRGYFDIFKCILLELSKGPIKKTHILNKCNLNSATASKYLNSLEDSNTIFTWKEGREIYYNLTDKGMLALLAMKGLYRLLLESTTASKCKELLRKVMSEEKIPYIEHAYLATDLSAVLPVTFFLPDHEKAIIVIEAPSEDITLLYSALIIALLSGLKDLKELIVISPVKMESLSRIYSNNDFGGDRLNYVDSCDAKSLRKALINSC